MMPKLQEKHEIGRACEEFDHSVLSQPSGNEKRRQEGKQVRSNNSKNNKRQRDDEARVCWDFVRRGSCKWGNRCRLLFLSLIHI